MSGKPKTERTTITGGRRELKEIIETCDAISERRFNPFFLDVELGVETLRKYYPKWESFNDHCLDAHTQPTLRGGQAAKHSAEIPVKCVIFRSRIPNTQIRTNEREAACRSISTKLASS